MLEAFQVPGLFAQRVACSSGQAGSSGGKGAPLVTCPACCLPERVEVCAWEEGGAERDSPGAARLAGRRRGHGLPPPPGPPHRSAGSWEGDRKTRLPLPHPFGAFWAQPAASPSLRWPDGLAPTSDLATELKESLGVLAERQAAAPRQRGQAAGVRGPGPGGWCPSRPRTLGVPCGISKDSTPSPRGALPLRHDSPLRGHPGAQTGPSEPPRRALCAPVPGASQPLGQPRRPPAAAAWG